MAKSQRREGAGGAGEASAASRDILVGRIGVNRLSSITRVPLDADDLRSIKSAPSNAAAAARVANGSLGSSPHKKHAGVNADGSESRRRGSALALGDDDGRDMYGVAAFALDSACETGRVALVYGAPLSSAAHPQRRKTQSSSPPARGHPTSAMAAGGFANPEVWIQDLSCRRGNDARPLNDVSGVSSTVGGCALCRKFLRRWTRPLADSVDARTQYQTLSRLPSAVVRPARNFKQV